MGAIEPLAAVGKLAPNVVIPLSGGGPSHGASTRTSTPRARNTGARPRTCSCTPPGTDKLYGQIIPTRIEGYSLPSWSWRSAS